MAPLSIKGLIAIFLVGLTSAQKCDLVKEAPVLEDCLQPLMKVWNDTKRIKPQLELLTFPLLNVEPQELSSLCTRYRESRNKCGSQMDNCDGNIQANFVKKHFGYACKNNSDYSRDANCIWSTINSNQQCVLLLRKNDEPSASECHQLTLFYKCIEPVMQVKCRTKGVAALVHLLDNYGCNLAALEEKDLGDRSCDVEDQKAINTCFEPLTNIWNQVKQTDAVVENLSFPLFFFKSVDVVRMCDLVEIIKDECPPIRQCPSHPLPVFTNALLGLACGSQQNAFFSSFECIQSTLKQNDQCSALIPGVWIPGKHKDACWRVPQFISCIKDQMIFRCAPQGLAVLAQALRQYGCAVDIGDISLAVLPPGSRPELPKNGTDAPVRVTAPPGVPTILPPGQTAAPITIGSPPGPQGPAAPPAPPPNAAPPPNSQPQLSPQSFDSLKSINDDKILQPPPSVISGIPLAAAFAQEQKGASQAGVVPSVVEIQTSDVCDTQKRNQVRQCLQPLFARWVQVQTDRQLGNLTFPMYHYDRTELLELCDHYASAFLICPFSVFQQCLRDEVVFLANSVLGFFCSPQNVVVFMKHYDCISQVIRERPFCEKFISGPLLLGVDIGTRCKGVREFLTCNLLAIEQTCGSEASSQFQESARQFGCSPE